MHDHLSLPHTYSCICAKQPHTERHMSVLHSEADDASVRLIAGPRRQQMDAWCSEKKVLLTLVLSICARLHLSHHSTIVATLLLCHLHSL